MNEIRVFITGKDHQGMAFASLLMEKGFRVCEQRSLNARLTKAATSICDFI